MTTILQINRNELREEIKSVLFEAMEELKSLPVPEPEPDEITLAEACEITGLGKSSIYKLTMSNEIPYSKFGKRLFFSRKQLTAWMQERTISVSASETIDMRLKRSAEKYLKR